MIDLRELIDACERSNAGNDDHGDEAWAALRAVADLHVDDAGDCRECGVDAVEEPIPWPCATVRAITTALEAK